AGQDCAPVAPRSNNGNEAEPKDAGTHWYSPLMKRRPDQEAAWIYFVVGERLSLRTSGDLVLDGHAVAPAHRRRTVAAAAYSARLPTARAALRSTPNESGAAPVMSAIIVRAVDSMARL